MRLLFIMDAPERINPDRDTTFALMLAAHARGFDIGHTRKEWIWHREGQTFCRWQPVVAVRREGPEHLVLGDPREGRIEEHDVVLVRTDPPFDLEYVKLTWMLDVVDSTRTLVMNDPRGIRDANEKLSTLWVPDLVPPQIVTRDMDRLEAFMDEMGGRMVVKPIDWMGGYGVFVVSREDGNRRAILEVSTRDGRDLIVAQAYLPEARAGDKRILLLDGVPMGAVMRVPAEGEHRGNIHVGARTEASSIDEDDRRICESLAPHLRERGLCFVGIDVIGGKLTEINVTSPTGIQEMERFDGVDYSGQVIDFLASRAPCSSGS